MSTEQQPELNLAPQKRTTNRDDVEWFIGVLKTRDWITAGDLLEQLRIPVTENNKRWLRDLASASDGRICGHKKGYKLTTAMTHEEYNWWRNEWLKADESIRARIVATDKVFYSRQRAG